MTEEVRQLEHMIEIVARMIPAEQRSVDVYHDVASGAKLERWRLLFEHLADQEKQHLDKLRATLEILQNELREMKRGAGS